MKPMLALAALVALTSFYCSNVEEHVVSTLLGNYVTAQEALANDDLGGATRAFQAMAGEGDLQVGKMAEELAASADLDSARTKFKQLSEEFASMDLPEGFVVAHCPMADEGKGADWVQKEGDVANPYFGSSMRDCGTIKEQN